MLRQRSSEVMDGHALCSARRTRRLPDNWLSSQLVIFAHDNVASVQMVGENCIVNMANRLTDEECKYGAKKQRTLRGGGCIFNSEFGKNIPRNSGQQPKCSEGVGAYCVAFWYRNRPRRKTRCEASSHRAGNTHRKGSVTFGQHQ